MVAFVAIAFYLLATTADNYFSPTLGAICFQLNIPHHLAGVTFAALGNGAPDVFSSWAAFSQNDPSPELALGALLGAGTFILTVVLGAVVLVVDQPIRVNALPFVRDIGFFFVTIAVILFKGLSGTAHTLGTSLTFVSIYVIYVVVVFLQHYWSGQKTVAAQLEADPEEERQHEAISSFWHRSDEQLQNLGDASDEAVVVQNQEEEEVNQEGETARVGGPPVEVVEDHIQPRVQEDGWFSPFSETFSMQEEAGSSGSSALSELLLSGRGGSEDIDLENVGEPRMPGRQRSIIKSQVLEDLHWRNLRLRRHAAQKLKLSQADMRNMSCSAIARWALEMPATALRVVTIPTIDPEDWSKYLVALHPAACTLFCLWVWRVPVYRSAFWTIFVVFAVLSATLFVFFTTHVSKPPSEIWYKMLLLLCAFVCSIAWVYALAKELVALLCTIGQVISVSPTVLGLTVLAWGNSCGDFVTNPAVARKGYVQMACSVCFGAPLLNILLGLGGGMIILCARQPNSAVNVPMDAVAILSSITLLLILSIILFSAWRKQFALEPKLAYGLFGCYALYIILALILS